MDLAHSAGYLTREELFGVPQGEPVLDCLYNVYEAICAEGISVPGSK